MVEVEYFGFGGQYHAKVARSSAGKVFSVYVETYIVVPELISSAWVKPNRRYMNISFVILKTIHRVKS